ncbi:hypothetical protein J5690_08480 [bacterium]|nr:hypothetical protein [bacterium]
MKMKDNEYALALRDFVFDRIADKEARRELCGLVAGEYCNDDTLLDLLPRYCDAMCDGLDRGSKAYIEHFKKSFREVIEDFWDKCEEVPFIPYPESELWNEVLTDGIAPVKYDDGRCEIWRKTANKIIATSPHIMWNKEGKLLRYDEKIIDLFTKLFGDSVTTEMFFLDCWKKTDLAEVVGVMREKLEFYKKKTAEELEKMSDTEVIDFFEETFGKKHFRYFDLAGSELSSKFINKYRYFFLIYSDSEHHMFYNHDGDDEDIPEEDIEMIKKGIENGICS